MHTKQIPWSSRVVGAALALAVVVAHVSDQGSITAFADPDWLGWGYRLIEVGGLLTALTLLVVGGWELSWAAAVLLGIAPFLGYLSTRTFAMPGDAGDKGNWNDWPGTMSLLVEGALFLLALSVLLPQLRRRSATASTPAAPQPVAPYPVAA